MTFLLFLLRKTTVAERFFVLFLKGAGDRKRGHLIYINGVHKFKASKKDACGANKSKCLAIHLFLRGNWNFISLRTKGEKLMPIWKTMKVSAN